MTDEEYKQMSTVKLAVACEALTKIIENPHSPEYCVRLAISAMQEIDPEKHSPWATRIKKVFNGN